MKKSVRIHLLVITTVVAIFAFAGIWYLRPGVPNELIEQARARQLQPLLEINAPMRKPISESLPKGTADIDRKALAQELLPSLTDQVSRSLEGPLYEKLKAQLIRDEAFASQLSTTLQGILPMGEQTGTPEIPQGLQAEFTRQVDALRSELLTLVGEGQSSFFFQIEGMLDSRLSRIEDDLKVEMQAYVPQLVDRMIPSLVEMIIAELDANKETYLSLLAKELEPYTVASFTEEDLVLLYGSYRDQIVMDLVPAILTALEDPARKEVAAMVETLITPTEPVPSPPSSVTSVVKRVPTLLVEPVVPTPPVPSAVVSVPAVPATSAVTSVPAPPVTSTVVSVPPPPATSTVTSVPTPPATGVPTTTETMVPQAPMMKPATSAVVEPEPILAVPVFATDEPEVFVDPVVYEQKRTEIRNKAIQEVLQRINAL